MHAEVLKATEQVDKKWRAEKAGIVKASQQKMVDASEKKTSKETRINEDTAKQKKEVRDRFMKKITKVESNEKAQASQIEKEKEAAVHQAKEDAAKARQKSNEEERAAIKSAIQSEAEAKSAAVQKKAQQYAAVSKEAQKTRAKGGATVLEAKGELSPAAGADDLSTGRQTQISQLIRKRFAAHDP